MHKKPSSNTTESLWTESPWTSNLRLVRLTCSDPFLRRPDLAVLAETVKEEEVKEKAPEERAVEEEEEEEERDAATDHQGPPMEEEKVEEEEEVGVVEAVEAEPVAERTDPKCLSRISTNNWKTTPMAVMAQQTKNRMMAQSTENLVEAEEEVEEEEEVAEEEEEEGLKGQKSVPRI